MGGAVKAISNVVSSVVDFVVKTVEKVVDFAVNVVTGVLKNVVGVVAGAITGDWTKFRDSLLGVVSTALYGVAAVVGFATGQYYITAAALVALDGQYNEGQLTSHIVTTVGKFEREIFGSKIILDNEINGKILNGHQDMEVETGKAIFIENEKISPSKKPLLFSSVAISVFSFCIVWVSAKSTFVITTFTSVIPASFAICKCS